MTPKRLYFAMIGCLALAILGSLGGIYWANGMLKSKSQTVAGLMAERDAQTDQINKLRSSKNTADQSQKLNDLINSLLPKQKKQENLVADIIYTSTKQAGVLDSQITNISFNNSGAPTSLSGTSQSKDIQGVYVYPFTLQLKDISYQTMLQLFSEFERNKRIIQADQVQIAPDKSKPGYLTSVSLSLKTFVQP